MNNTEQHSFRLYVADDAPNSAQAISNLRHFCLAHLPHRHEIEVVDVLKHPRRGLADGIILTPTLIRLTPLPVLRIIGTLSNTRILRESLGLDPLQA